MIPLPSRSSAIITVCIGGLLVILGFVFLVLGAISWGLVDIPSVSLLKENKRKQAVSEVMKIIGLTAAVIGTVMLLVGFSLCTVGPFVMKPKCQFNKDFVSDTLPPESSSSGPTRAPEYSTEIPLAGDLPHVVIYESRNDTPRPNLFRGENANYSKDMKHLVHFDTKATLDGCEPCKLNWQPPGLAKTPIEPSTCQPSVLDLTEPTTLADTLQPTHTLDDQKVSVERLISLGGGDTIFSQPMSSPTPDSQQTMTPWDSHMPGQQDQGNSSGFLSCLRN